MDLCEFKASLVYRASQDSQDYKEKPCLKEQTNNSPQNKPTNKKAKEYKLQQMYSTYINYKLKEIEKNLWSHSEK